MKDDVELRKKFANMNQKACLYSMEGLLKSLQTQQRKNTMVNLMNPEAQEYRAEHVCEMELSWIYFWYW